MRIFIFFFIGLISFFYLGDLFDRVFKKTTYSYFGLIFILVGLTISATNELLITHPLDVYISTFLLGSGLGLIIHHLLKRHFVFFPEREKRFYFNHEKGFDRLLESLPGILTWTLLTSPIWLSLTFPFALAYLILLADIYWLFSAIRTAVLIYIGHRRVEYTKSQPWLELIKKDFPETWQNYYHVFVIPVYKESLEVLAPAFDAIANANYPKEKIFLAVGFEQRSNPEEFHKETLQYLNQLKSKIGGVFVSIHPFGLPGEVIGPGTNRNWMIKNALAEFKKLKIDPAKVIATTLDADFVIHPEYLSGTLHKYLSIPEETRDKRSFTGVFYYHNNYWQAPTPMRLIATGASFWQLAEMVGSDKYRNFSSLSINFKSLLDIGGWFPDKVNDDSGFYWRAYFHFKGDYKVLPHFLPISADTNLDKTLFKTFINQYQQLKRWAYGVEHIPYIFKQYFSQKGIDFWDKTDKLLFSLWGDIRWGFLAPFVAFAGSIITYLNPQYSQSVLSINLPIVSSYVLTAAFLGLFVTIYTHEKTVPQRPKSWGFIAKLWSYIQWLLIPVVLVTMSTIPAIDAQTTLLFGKHLEYRTTNKARLSND